jgi:hypothetical protein
MGIAIILFIDKSYKKISYFNFLTIGQVAVKIINMIRSIPCPVMPAHDL